MANGLSFGTRRKPDWPLCRRNGMIGILLLLTFPLALFSQSSDEDAIRKASQKFSADYVKGDFESMTKCYTVDAVIMAPSRDVITGHEAILAFWKTTTIPATHESVSEKIVVEGSTAHDYGYFYAQTQKPGETVGPVSSAKYYIRWEKGVDGNWRMALDMWNSRKQGWTK